MQRALVFLMVGPLTVALGHAGVGSAGAQANPGSMLIAMAFFLLTLPVSAVVGVIDGCLARRFPIALRACR